MEKYLNRKDAGEKLAEEILKTVKIDVKNTIVLGLARGGVVVAKAIADVLKVPIDVLVVKKLSFLDNSEFGVGAVSEHTLAVDSNFRPKELKKQIDEKRKEIQEKIQFYGYPKNHLFLKDKTVIIVDDGLAMGYTMEAAIKEVRIQKPEKIIIAVPVAPEDTLERIKSQVDQVICPWIPSPFWSVGNFYLDFSQTTDDEVEKIISQVP